MHDLCIDPHKQGFLSLVSNMYQAIHSNLHQKCCGQVAQLGDAAVDGNPGEPGSIGQL